ncbi:lysylphosphatidylglycerol synthase transmembrane domain-containing protein [Phreatobacter sp.]|uniref:lysylphosphatidylglycerol synthase transmembrane domain-containing protein n=1 Tax=Phreatobacter sp. TaxID=1966341 RepID=UPI003F6F0C16
MTAPITTGAVAPRPSYRIWWILGWGVLAAFFAVAAVALPWAEVVAALAGAKWHWVALAVLIWLAEWPLWILQWVLLAPRQHRPGFVRMAQVTGLCGTANASVPMAGVVASVGFLIVRGRMPASAAASLYAVDQLQTGIAKVAILALATVLLPVPDWLRTGLLSLAGAVLLFTVALLGAAHGGQWLRRLGLGLGERAARLVRLVADVVDHLEAMRRPVLGLATTVLALAKKGMEVVAVLAVQVAVGIEPSLAAAVLVVAALGLTTMAPISPGHFGVYEATVILCYQYLGVPLPLATAAAFIQHGVTFAVSFVMVGYLAWALPRGDRDGRQDGPSAP